MEKLYVVILFFSSFISGVVGIVAWKRKPIRGATTLFILMISIFIWCLFQGLQFLEVDFKIKIIYANIRYFGIELAPISFYVLAYEYKEEVNDFNIKKWVLFLLFPFINIIAIWTNPMHLKFYKNVFLENNILVLENGILYWINMGYLYLFVFSSIYIFIKASINLKAIYRSQAFILAAAAFFPVLSNILFNFEILPFKNIDLTPFSFFIIGILYFYALFQFKLFDIVPVAKDRLIEEMEDIVIVVDNQKRVLELNKKARDTIIKNNDKSYIRKDVFVVFEDWKELGECILNSSNKHVNINYLKNSSIEYYNLRISDIYSKKGYKYGELIILRDITGMEKALLEAKNAKEQAEKANTYESFR